MEVNSINWLIDNRMRPEHHEGETKRIWLTILPWFYTATTGYATGAEMTMNGTETADIVVTHIKKIRKINELNFLIVECKAPHLFTPDTHWNDAFDELKRYLTYTYTARGYTARGGKRLFGAVAIGKGVKFYEWDGSSAILLSGDAPLYIDRECRTVMSWLEYARDNHV